MRPRSHHSHSPSPCTLLAQLLCDHVHITLNKNTIHGDRNALNPGAVRIGTPALTTRGFTEKDFATVATLLNKAVELVKKIQVCFAFFFLFFTLFFSTSFVSKGSSR
jgi:hypothetical protein